MNRRSFRGAAARVAVVQVDAKRAFDLATAAALLVLTSPLLVTIALAVRVDSKGPAIFRQERVGRHGTTFRIHKFRSLRVDSPGALVSPTNDPRVTRVGAILRRTKLDELPQLLDVLGGHMSLVGPRPEVPRFVGLWSDADRSLILSVRPGITDPASIALRHEADELAAVDDPESYYVSTLLPRKTAMYADYVRTRSFGGDLRLIGRTLQALVARSN